MGEGSAREHIPPAKPQLCLAQPGAGSAQHPQEPCWAGAALPGLFFLLNIKISEVPKSTAPTPTAAMSSAGASRVLGAAGPALDPAELPGGKAWAPLLAPILPGPAPSPAAGGVPEVLRSPLTAALPASSSRDRVRVDVVEEEELGAHGEAQLLLEEAKEKRVRAGNRGGCRNRSFGGVLFFSPNFSHTASSERVFCKTGENKILGLL